MLKLLRSPWRQRAELAETRVKELETIVKLQQNAVQVLSERLKALKDGAVLQEKLERIDDAQTEREE